MSARLMVERNLLVYRRGWPYLAAEVLEPLLYLFSIGVGVGKLVGDVPGLDGVPYAEFVAPALLATSAMNGAVNETVFTVFGRITADRTYTPILATPMTVRDVAMGEAWWAVLRGLIASCGFLVLVTVFGLVHSPWAVLTVPGAALIGFAFAGAGLYAVTWLRDWHDFQLVQLVMLPMFLFATTFYPLSVYPGWLRPLIACLPLYQCIELLRGPALGDVGPGLLVPVVYLSVMGLAGLRFGVRRLERRLLP
ncbi:ABC transporter permease [Actinocorallia longicatena]|uniref:Transport permease protein n=1 Tax=Actinocorallia longicatena TaxID=111803 RepID=A0ABP6QIC5_9ACTN